MSKYTHNSEVNQVKTSLAIFMENYNTTIPKGFPQATVSILNRFQLERPSLFEEDKQWSIDKHRKRFMDWLSSHHD